MRRRERRRVTSSRAYLGSTRSIQRVEPKYSMMGKAQAFEPASPKAPQNLEIPHCCNPCWCPGQDGPPRPIFQHPREHVLTRRARAPASINASLRWIPLAVPTFQDRNLKPRSRAREPTWRDPSAYRRNEVCPVSSTHAAARRLRKRWPPAARSPRSPAKILFQGLADPAPLARPAPTTRPAYGDRCRTPLPSE